MNFAECLEQITNSAISNRLSIWAGAGVSCNPPACLPLARELKFHILERICSDGSLHELYKNRLYQNGDIGSKIEEYPFEAFIECIARDYEILDAILTMLRAGSPNENHDTIARLAAKGCIQEILTTNLDLLIEKALESIGLSRSDDFQVYFTEKQFSATRLDRDLPVIFKIHGSADHEDSVRIMLSDVASETLSESRVRILQHFLCSEEGDLLIVGYSGRDEFDINPALSRLSPKKRIFYVLHRPQVIEMGKGVTISTLPYPFQNFRGCTLVCDTDEVIRDLRKVILDD